MKNGYHDRALRARDPRFARIFGKLGYERRDMVATAEEQKLIRDVEIADLRVRYSAKHGKRPFMGWDAETLRQKIAAPRSEV